MDSEKSRRERRKEARLEKNKRKFDSWVQHQKSCKTKKNSWDAEYKKVKESQKNVHTLDNKSKVMPVEFYQSSCQSLEEPVMHEDLEAKGAPGGVCNSNALKVIKTKNGSERNPKSKLEEYLELEKMLGSPVSAEVDLRLERKLAKKLRVKDGTLGGADDDINKLLEGIPCFFDSLGGEENPFAKEASRKSTKDDTSRIKCKSKLVKEKPDGDTVSDDMEHCMKVKTSAVELDSLKNLDSLPPKTAKVKKTKFEEYIELDNQQGYGEEDIALERKLAKKLKVKEGKLWRDDDGINLLFEGIPSVVDSLEEKKILDGEGTPATSPEKGYMYERHKMKSRERELDVDAAGDSMVIVSEQGKTSGAQFALEIVPAKATVPEGRSKYVAPHLRSHAGDESEEYSQICRRVRGLLNKLSESNVESITGEMSTIFHSMGRTAASQIISEVVLASCSGGPRGNEQHAAVFAAFVAGMVCLVGIDFGAKLFVSLAKCFEDEYLEEDNLSLRNLTLLLSYLYVFGVCSSELIYDFLIMLSKRLMEIDVSTILTILQCCGMRLRGDDPAAMKNFILSVQGRVNEMKSSGNLCSNMSSKRMEFMLETICDIKNNKKRQKEDTVQHTRIRKWLQKLRVEDILIRGLKWNKLLDPDKRGQWWLSGEMGSSRDNIEEVANTIDREVPETQKMLQLAAAQRMNTDARRAIFCIIMSGDDYIDAFEKLLRLDLPGKQDREIVRVLVECCLQEKVFNKYYCVLASKLCSHDKNHKFTLQYCIWDLIKELETMQLLRSMHLAKFVAEMLASFSLSLVVLKVVDLSNATQLTPKRILHFRMLFEAILEFSDRLVWNIFTRIAVTPEYEALRNGIKCFVSKYVVSCQRSLVEKFKLAKKALNNVEGVLL